MNIFSTPIIGGELTINPPNLLNKIDTKTTKMKISKPEVSKTTKMKISKPEVSKTTKMQIPKSQIYDIVKDMKELSHNECPKEVTYEMLIKEMDCRDLQALISSTPFNKEEITNKLWHAFYVTFFTKSPFGFYNISNDSPETDTKSDEHVISAIPAVIDKKIIPIPSKSLLNLGEVIIK